MATIRSRCQKLKFSRPDPTIAEDWLRTKNITGSATTLLNLANGAPLKALLLADEDAAHERGVLHSSLEKLLSGEQSVIEAAVQCAEFDIADNIEGMMLCITDVLEHNQSEQQEMMHDPELQGLAKSLKGKMRIQALHKCYQDLITAKSALNSTANPNPQLILESLFYNWSRLKNVPLTQAGIGLS
jgi:DNA polymerase III subunit delta'